MNIHLLDGVPLLDTAEVIWEMCAAAHRYSKVHSTSDKNSLLICVLK